jgi:hypothetical protein
MIRHTVRAKDGGNREVSLTPLKAIRYQCLECMGFVTSEVKRCTSPLCSLFPYKLGTNPERKGISGNFGQNS